MEWAALDQKSSHMMTVSGWRYGTYSQIAKKALTQRKRKSERERESRPASYLGGRIRQIL